MKADAVAATNFLQLLYPEGPWVLVAIRPDVADVALKTSAATFGPGSAAACQAWIADQNRSNDTPAGGHANVYYHVNQVARSMSKKAERADIARMPFVHVDADPRIQDRDDPTPKLEYLKKELARLLLKFGAELPAGIPRPTAVVSSGSGVNAIWRLVEPVVIDGDLAAAEHFKRYNITLENIFGGDHCHNVDRILRLPGTVNWPDHRKRARGREPVMATLEWFEPTSYPLSMFVPAPAVQAAKPERGKLSGTSEPRVKISGNVPRVGGDVRELVKACTKITDMGLRMDAGFASIVALGYDPNDPSRFGGDRSRAVFYVCCELVRLGASDDVIYGVITDPELGISGHVLDQGSNAHRCAERHITKAKDVAIDPHLAELNEKYAVIKSFGGKCVIVHEEVDDIETGRARLVRQSREDFCNAYANRTVEVKFTAANGRDQVKHVPLGQWWFTSPYRQTFDRVVFEPGRDVPGAYNLWQGFAVAPLPGNGHQPYVDHVRNVICGGDAKLFAYVWSWMARAVQQPAAPAEVAIVMRAGQGAGKGTFVSWFGALWGRHYLHISDVKHLTGNFNAHLGQTCLLFADEAFYAGDPATADRLKRLITEHSLTIERKGIDVESTRNHLKLIVASNHEWVLRVDSDDRRLLFLDVNEQQRGNQEYWDAINVAMAMPERGGKGGLANLLFALETHDISNFNIRQVPKTAGHRDQVMRSMTPTESWWFSKLWDGVLAPGYPWGDPIPKRTVFDDYIVHATRQRVPRPESATTLGKFLQKATEKSIRDGRMTIEVRDPGPAPSRTEVVPFYQMPSVEVCRAAWDRVFAGPTDWPSLEVTPLPLRRSAVF